MVISQAFKVGRGPLFAISLLLVSGCVLTTDQKSAVTKFASATKNYGTLPGAVVTNYSDGLITRNWTMVAMAQKPSDSQAPAQFDSDNKTALGLQFDELAKAETRKAQFEEQAEKANKALAILDTYSDLLTKLTSDDYTTALNTDATNLSDDLNKATSAFNSQYHLTGANALPDVGSTVAEIIRGAGGIYIRYEQEKALKAGVNAADPLVQKLTAQIVDFMGQFTTTDVGFLDGDLTTLRQSYISDGNVAFTTTHSMMGYDALQAFVSQAESLANTKKLAQSSASAAEKYASAHAALVKAVNAPESVKTAVDQIDVLKTEVQNAKKLKSTIDSAKATK